VKISIFLKNNKPKNLGKSEFQRFLEKYFPDWLEICLTLRQNPSGASRI